MGLMKGSVSFTRFRVIDTLPDNYFELYPPLIRRFAYKNLEEGTSESKSEGWVSITDMLDSEFASMDFLKEPYLALSWRVDTKKVHPQTVKRYCIEAEREIITRESLEFLPRARRREISESVKAALTRRAIPLTAIYDMIWNLQTGIIYFGGISNKISDEFRSYFIKTFNLNIQPVFPYERAALALIDSKKEPSAVDNIKSAVFSTDKAYEHI